MDWIGRLLAWLEPWLAYSLGLMEGGSIFGLGAIEAEVELLRRGYKLRY